MEMAFTILRQRLNAEKYLTYLQVITPGLGDATKELLEVTEGISLQDAFDGAKSVERRIAGQDRWCVTQIAKKATLVNVPNASADRLRTPFQFFRDTLNTTPQASSFSIAVL